jgi:hypothetical protein
MMVDQAYLPGTGETAVCARSDSAFPRIAVVMNQRLAVRDLRGFMKNFSVMSTRVPARWQTANGRTTARKRT